MNLRITKRVLALSLGLLAGLSLLGQSPEENYQLGLREAIALSLSKNFSVRIDRMDPEKAEQRLRSSEGTFDPELKLSVGGISNETLGVDVEDRQELGSASVGGVLPWGSRYSVGVNGRDREQPFLGQAAGANGEATLRVTQPLLRSFGRTSSYAGVRIAEKSLDRSKLGLRATIMDTVARVITSYNSLYFAKRNLDIAITNRDLASQLMKDNNRRLEVGSIAESDLLVAETRYALRSETVLIAERQLREQENAMKQLVSDSVEGVLDVRIDVTNLEEPEPYEADPKQDFSLALELRPDYRSALLGIDIDRIEVDRDRRQRLPNLDLVGSLDYDAKGSSLGGSLSNLENDPADSYSLSTVFSMPLPNRRDRSQYALSKLDLKQAEIGLDQLKQRILLRLDNAARRVTSSWERIQVTREARLLAEKSLVAEEKKLNLGVSRSFFVLEQQGDLANAQVREMRAITDYFSAVANYELEKGTILEAYGISSY